MPAAPAPPQPGLLVVKVGGSCLDDLDGAWWDRLAELAGGDGAGHGGVDQNGPAAGPAARAASGGARLVVVHGWSRMVSAVTPAGQPDFIVDKHGFRSRYTTPEVLAEIERVAAGLRERIAALLRERGLRTEAVCGACDRLLHAELRENMWWVGDELVPLTNLVGPVRDVDRPRLDALLADNDAVVVSPLAAAGPLTTTATASVPTAGGGDADAHRGAAAIAAAGGDAARSAQRPQHVNTDADRAAAAIAATAGGAARLALVMDAEAVLADGEPVRAALRSDLRRLAGHAKGGMAKKLRAVEEALAGGVRQVAIGSAAVPDLLAGRAGTLIAADPDAPSSR